MATEPDESKKRFLPTYRVYDGIERTEDEQQAYDAIQSVLVAFKQLGLKYNENELVAAIHTLQQMVNQHVLHRLDPEFWNDWYGD